MITDTTRSAHTCLHSLPLGAVTLDQGFWMKRQQVNRIVSIPQGYEKLDSAGNFNNFRLAVGAGQGQFSGPVFMDSDVYKWLEAAALDLANHPDPEMERNVNETIALIAAAQLPDGYLNTHVQVLKPDARWTDLDHDHEMYCAGHLIQAAVAHYRATGQTSLLDVATRFADHIDRVFGPGQREGYCGHPEIETALVELYRATGQARYLDLAKALIDRRGRRLMKGYHQWGPEYHQDHLPVREAGEVVGHAVRQLYLNAGVTDLFIETGEKALLDAQQRQWHDMVSRKSFVTGGEGARHSGEAFGEAYELPSRTCYCETCAAIASMMWSWRLLQATGEVRYADQFERALYNGFLSGIALDGTRYFYVNPLQSPGGIERLLWFGCACCPPNVMRQIASVQYFGATWNDLGLQLHQYFPGQIRAERPDGSRLSLNVQTRFPWNGRVEILVEECLGEWRLDLRLPGWLRGASLTVDGQPAHLPVINGTYAHVYTCPAGTRIVLDMDMEPHFLQSNPRVDMLRGSLAIQRGPLVYCLEQADQASGLNLMDITLNPHLPLKAAWHGDLLDGVFTVEAQGYAHNMQAWEEDLYLLANTFQLTQRSVALTAVPYYAWANRGAGAMRVWIPAV